MIEESLGRQARRAESPADAAGEPLLIAKFRIERGAASVIVRQRLFDRLSDGVRRPLTVVSAPAGAGKTTLVGSWASAGLSPGALTWITLDHGDEQPGVFWSYVLEGLSRAGVAVSTVAAPVQPDQVDQSVLIQLSASLYDRRDPVVVVLDDADVLSASSVLEQIDFLLRHAGPQLRIIMISRHPGRTLHRYRLAGSLTEIGSEDLAFTTAEGRLLLDARGISLSDDALSRLVQRTRGWAAGLVLAANAGRRHSDPGSAATAIAGDRGDLADYFVAEVLGDLAPDVRRFMLRTSIVAHLSPALADRLTGRRGAACTLAELARANSFVTVCSAHDGCYCYHPLFAELLRAQLDRDAAPTTVIRLHRTAAAWFAVAGSLTDAVRHAAAAEDWSPAATLLVRDRAIVRLLVGPDAPALAALFDGMPADADGPEAAVVLAALALRRADVDCCAKNLTRAQELVEEGPIETAGPLVLAGSIVELVLARTRADVDGERAAATVEAMLDELAAEGIAEPSGARQLLLLSTAGAHFAAGRAETAATTLARSMRAADEPGTEELRVAGLGLLALVEASRGRLTRAAELGHAAGTLADRTGLTRENRSYHADLALAWVHLEAVEASPARTHLDRALAADGIRTDPIAGGLVALVRSGLLRAAGDLDGAVTVLDRVLVLRACPAMPTWLEHRLRAAAAAVQVAADRPAGALRAIEAAIGSGSPYVALEVARTEFARGETAPAADRVVELLGRVDLPAGLQVEAWLLQASCALEQGDPAQARTAVAHASRVAEPERMRRPVAQAPARLRSFIRRQDELTARQRRLRAAARPSLGPHPTARATASGVDVRPAAVMVEPLTAKEQEVLRYLAALLSTEEIAQAMFVSVNTVKTHVRGILRKLAASRRNEAVRRAQDLQLI